MLGPGSNFPPNFSSITLDAECCFRLWSGMIMVRSPMSRHSMALSFHRGDSMSGRTLRVDEGADVAPWHDQGVDEDEAAELGLLSDDAGRIVPAIPIPEGHEARSRDDRVEATVDFGVVFRGDPLSPVHRGKLAQDIALIGGRIVFVGCPGRLPGLLLEVDVFAGLNPKDLFGDEGVFGVNVGDFNQPSERPMIFIGRVHADLQAGRFALGPGAPKKGIVEDFFGKAGIGPFQHRRRLLEPYSVVLSPL